MMIEKLAIFALVGLAAGCATVPPPMLVDVQASRSLREVHQCVTEQLVDRGFAITETRRDDGVLKGVRRREGRSRSPMGGTVSAIVEDRFEVLIFERNSGTTSIQYVADTYSTTDPPQRLGPSEQVSELPATLQAECGQ